MKKTPTPQQTFLVLSMFFGATKELREPPLSHPWVKALKPALRKELVAEGVLHVEKRGRTSCLRLGEEATEFVMRNLATQVPNTARAAPLLERVLVRVRDFLETNGHSLGEFVGQIEASKRTARLDSTADPEQAIRDACLALAHGETRRRVRLADLRKNVAVSRELLNETLLAMQTAGRLVLYKLDNPNEISVEDADAALYIADQPRHLVYLEA